MKVCKLVIPAGPAATHVQQPEAVEKVWQWLFPRCWNSLSLNTEGAGRPRPQRSLDTLNTALFRTPILPYLHRWRRLSLTFHRGGFIKFSPTSTWNSTLASDTVSSHLHLQQLLKPTAPPATLLISDHVLHLQNVMILSFYGVALMAAANVVPSFRLCRDGVS